MHEIVLFRRKYSKILFSKLQSFNFRRLCADDAWPLLVLDCRPAGSQIVKATRYVILVIVVIFIPSSGKSVVEQAG